MYLSGSEIDWYDDSSEILNRKFMVEFEMQSWLGYVRSNHILITRMHQKGYQFVLDIYAGVSVFYA
jgi:hypothetical protein